MYEDPNTTSEENSRLDAFGQSLAEKRKEAVDFRSQSGVEQIWQEDQEFYEGIDNLSKGTYEKPTTSTGRVSTRTDQRPAGIKSTVFINITQPYVDMAAARVADMLLPNDDMPFSLEPTPLPSLEEYEENNAMHLLPDGRQVPVKEVADAVREKAKKIAKRSELRIWDWLVESQWHAEGRKVIEDAARIGTGLLRGPIPARCKYKKVMMEDGESRVIIEYETKPRSIRGDVRNLYPDPACGDNIHNGAYVWYKELLSMKQLSELKGGDYLDDQIDLCLKEGPNGSKDNSTPQEVTKKKFEIWYYHGSADHKDLSAAGCDCDEGEQVPVIVTMVNDRVIKAAITPLDSGEFPYDVIPWQAKDNTWVGIGVGRQVREPQRVVNAGTRKMLDNSGLSSEPIKFFKRDSVAPAVSGSGYGLTPGKTFLVEGEFRRLDDFLRFVDIPNYQERFMAIIKWGLEMAERLTSMPLMMQGQQGEATETVGGMQILQNNASAVLRRIAKAFDDHITTPHIQRYYEWLLLYGEDPEEKGDSKIVAKGSTALFERDAQNQAILQMAAIVKDPAFDIDPKKWIVEALKAQKIEPLRIQYTEDEKKQNAEQMAQQPPIDPRVAGQIEVARVRTQGELEKEDKRQASTAAELELKENIEAVKIQHQKAEAEAQRAHDIAMKRMDFEMRLMEFAQEQRMSLDDAKVKLSDTRMKLLTQESLSDKVLASKRVPGQAATPPTEPAGKATPGNAYEE